MEMNHAVRQLQKKQSHKKVLLLEDDPIWQMVIKRSLKTFDENIDLECVQSVAQAQQLLGVSENYDLIIADQYVEGDLTGFDLWKDCQSSHRQIPFMMVSGMKDDEFFKLTEEATDLPMFLPKPFNMASFQRLVGWDKVKGVEFDKSVLVWKISAVGLAAFSLALVLMKPAPHVMASVDSAPRIEMKVASPTKSASTEVKKSHKRSPAQEIFSEDLKRKMAKVLRDSDQVIAMGIGENGETLSAERMKLMMDASEQK